MLNDIGYKVEPDVRNLSSIVNNTLNNAVCYSDILNNAGYNTYFIKGALLEFSGTGNFVKQHGFKKAEGFNELKKRLNIKNSKYYQQLNSSNIKETTFITLKINYTVSGNEIKNYTTEQIDQGRVALNINKFKAIWIDNLQFKILSNTEKNYVLRANFY